MTIMPEAAGAGAGEPAIPGGTNGAHPCPPIPLLAPTDRVVMLQRRITKNAATRTLLPRDALIFSFFFNSVKVFVFYATVTWEAIINEAAHCDQGAFAKGKSNN